LLFRAKGYTALGVRSAQLTFCAAANSSFVILLQLGFRASDNDAESAGKTTGGEFKLLI